jgi:hypothetical protein
MTRIARDACDATIAENCHHPRASAKIRGKRWVSDHRITRSSDHPIF